jgi:DNA topoisomerase-2
MTIENNGFTKFENDFKLVSTKMLGMTNMYLYNSQGQIQKYDTPFDIIRDFYRVRLAFYTKRKEYLCKQLEDDMKILENKMRFIKSVVSEELQVSKFKKVELEEHLRRNDYLCVNEGFEYLLRIPIYNLTIDKVEELEKEYSNIKHSHENIMGQSEKQMWLDELVSFEKAYDAFLMEYSDTYNVETTASTSKPKRRQPSKK